MPELPEKISEDQIKSALLRSGYLLEARVEERLVKNGFYVEANVNYPDPFTAKSREFDLYAMGAFNIGPTSKDFLFNVFLAECINNPQPLVILTKEPLTGFLHHHEVKMAGLPVKVNLSKGKGWQSLADFLGMQKYHHYCNGRVGTQYCTFSKKGKGSTKESPEWFATHDAEHFDAFRKLCEITEYQISKHFTNWSFGENEPINIEFYYPLLIVQGDLIEAYESNGNVVLSSVPHLQFRQSLIKDGKELTYQIDVIQEKYLEKYLGLTKKELKDTVKRIKDNRAKIDIAINKIVNQVKKVKSKSELRNVMGFD